MAGDDDGEDKTETTFTRAQMAREVNRQVREKVAAALAEYGDLDELKSKAAEADKQKSQLDKVSEQLDALTKRAEAAEIENDRRKVADELGLTPKEAKRLRGKTYAELKADADELVDDLGIDVKARKQGKTKSKATDTGGDSDTDDDSSSDDNDTDNDGDEQQQTQREERRSAPRRRPRELRSGASMSGGDDRDVSDPLKLIENVPRGR
jgi:hypothetical protein